MTGEGSSALMERNLELLRDWNGEMVDMRIRMTPERWRRAELTHISVFVERIVPMLEGMQRMHNGTVRPSDSATVESFIKDTEGLLSQETLNAVYRFMERSGARFTEEFRTAVLEGIVRSGNAPLHLLRDIERGSPEPWLRKLAQAEMRG